MQQVIFEVIFDFVGAILIIAWCIWVYKLFREFIEKGGGSDGAH